MKANHSSLYQVPSLGGTPRQILFDVDSPIGFSPDGKRFVFVRQSPENMTSTLMVANADGNGARGIGKCDASRFLRVFRAGVVSGWQTHRGTENNERRSGRISSGNAGRGLGSRKAAGCETCGRIRRNSPGFGTGRESCLRCRRTDRRSTRRFGKWPIPQATGCGSQTT